MDTRKMKLALSAGALALSMALAGCGGSSSSGPPTGPTAEEQKMARQMEQREAIKMAREAADMATKDLSADSSDDDLNMADMKITEARNAIMAAADLPDNETAADTRTVNAYAARITTARSNKQTAMNEAEMEADMAMMATAMKLHMGINPPTGDAPAETRRHATYDGVDIAVSIGTAEAVDLSEDKKTMVAENHGWMGKRYADPAGGDMVEAMVYSNVEDPTEGDPFNEEYTLDTTTGETENITTLTDYEPGRVASPSFDQSAGMKEFKLPTNTVRVMVPGMYHGVSGTYYCTPEPDGTCSSTVAASGFTLAGGIWTFKPTDPKAKVMSVDDMIYASYGWWIHKSADDKTYTASAFAADKGTVPDAEGITTLRGTATYMGGAAGKYALYSSTGGTNDAGHFTAKATLDADFNADTISGTIDSFMGADGMARNWSVELKKSVISDTGGITNATADGSEGNQMTVWTIDGTAAAAAGQWSGSLQDNGDDGVPKVGTGTFHSTYSTSGSMVGAFGVNVQ